MKAADYTTRTLDRALRRRRRGPVQEEGRHDPISEGISWRGSVPDGAELGRDVPRRAEPGAIAPGPDAHRPVSAAAVDRRPDAGAAGERGGTHEDESGTDQEEHDAPEGSGR